MFGKLLFFFEFPKLGISYKVKKHLDFLSAPYPVLFHILPRS